MIAIIVAAIAVVTTILGSQQQLHEVRGERRELKASSSTAARMKTKANLQKRYRTDDVLFTDDDVTTCCSQ